jgi:hypothetical protein
MLFTIKSLNYGVYFNLTSNDHTVTMTAAGQARFEVKAPNGSQVTQLQTGSLGGGVSMRVPAQHRIEVDGPSTGVSVEILSVA